MNQKRFANIILVVVIIILVGAVGYFTFVKKSKPITQPPTSQATNLKTYTNKEYSFEFKYPANLYAITMFYSSKNISVCDTNNREGSLNQNCYFGLDYYDNLYDLVGGQAGKSGAQVSTVLEYINARGWSEVTKENLSETSGYCGTYSLPNEKIVRACIFEYNGHFFGISKPDTELGKQIFSTFIFTK